MSNAHGQQKGGLMQGLKEGVQKVKENVSGNKDKHDDLHTSHNTSANTYGTNAPLGGGVPGGNTTAYGAEGQQAYGTGNTVTQGGYPTGVTATGTQGVGYSSGLPGTGGYSSGNTGYGNTTETGHHGHGQEKGGLMQGLKEGAQKVKENVSSNKGKHDDYNTGDNTYGTNTPGYGAEGQQAYGTGNTGTGYSSGLAGTGTQAGGYSSGLTGTGAGGYTGTGGYSSGNTGYGNTTETGHHGHHGHHGHGHGQEKGGLMQGLKEGAQKVKENVSGNKGDNSGYGAEGQQAYGTGTQAGYPSSLAGTGAGGYNNPTTGLSGGVGQGYTAGQEYPSDTLQSQNAGLSNQGRVQRNEY